MPLLQMQQAALVVTVGCMVVAARAAAVPVQEPEHLIQAKVVMGRRGY